MSQDQALQLLLRILETHSIAFKEEDIKWAFDAKSTQKVVVDWVQEFLGPETLLSQEEAELYSQLEGKGTARRIATSHDLSTVRPFFDNQIRAALKSSKDSTSAIERHNEILKQQKQALLQFQESSDQTRESSKRTAAHRHKKRTQEKQNIELAVEELVQTTSTDTDAAQRHLQVAYSAFPSVVAESLLKDDRALARTDRLARELKVSDVDDEHQITRLRELCKRLSTYLADEIRCRLDRIYLETSRSPTKSTSSSSGDEADLQSSLEAELDTLYSEITAVAQMSTSLEFEKPLIEASRQKKVQNESYIRSVLDHIEDSVAYLLEKMDHMIMRAEIHASHCAALDAVVNHLHEPQISTPQTRSLANNKIGNPSFHSKSTSKEASLKIPSNFDTRRLLSTLGIPPLDDLKPKDIEDILDLTASDRERKRRDGSSSVERSINEVLTSCLNDSSLTQQTIVDTLLADTAYHTVEMFDPELRSQLNTLQADIGKLGAEMVDLDLGKLNMSNQERDRFVNQWAYYE